jgi:hypothetical protein
MEPCNDCLAAERQTFLTRCSSQPISLQQKAWSRLSRSRNGMHYSTLTCLVAIIPSSISLLCLFIASHHSFRDLAFRLTSYSIRSCPVARSSCVCWSLHQRIPQHRLPLVRTRMRIALPSVILFGLSIIFTRDSSLLLCFVVEGGGQDILRASQSSQPAFS